MSLTNYATSEAWVGWAAGLFEGEGSVSRTISKRDGREYHYPVASLAMIDEDTVRKFAGVVGVGNVSGPHGPYGTSKLPQWRWCAYGHTKVSTILEQFEPFLGTRRKEKFATSLAKVAGRVV